MAKPINYTEMLDYFDKHAIFKKADFSIWCDFRFAILWYVKST